MKNYNRYAVVFALALAGGTAFGMPYAFELKSARPVVDSLIGDCIKAANSGKMDRVEAAERIHDLVSHAHADAEKYILLTECFKQYGKAGDYEAATDVLDELLVEFPDIPAQEIVSLIEKNTRNMSRNKSARLFMRLTDARNRVKCFKIAKDAERALKKCSFDSTARRTAAEAYAIIGDWDKALHHFAKGRGKSAEMAIGELNSSKDIRELADFWWSYRHQSFLGETVCFMRHGAELYRKALEIKSLSGLAKTLATNRVSEMEQQGVLVRTAEFGRGGPTDGNDFVNIDKLDSTKATAIAQASAMADVNGDWSSKSETVPASPDGVEANMLRFRVKIPLGARGTVCSLRDSNGSQVFLNIDGKGWAWFGAHSNLGVDYADQRFKLDLTGEHEICCYYDPQRCIKLYVDGALAGQSTHAHYSWANTRQYCIGMRNDGNNALDACRFKDAEVFCGQSAEKVAACLR